MYGWPIRLPRQLVSGIIEKLPRIPSGCGNNRLEDVGDALPRFDWAHYDLFIQSIPNRKLQYAPPAILAACRAPDGTPSIESTGASCQPTLRLPVNLEQPSPVFTKPGLSANTMNSGRSLACLYVYSNAKQLIITHRPRNHGTSRACSKQPC
jgi:hypothetical protein